MENISLVSVIIAAVIGCLIIVKTVHFFLYINRKKLKYWFNFNHAALISSKSAKSKKAKKLQNLFSFLLAITVLLEVMSFLINKA